MAATNVSAPSGNPQYRSASSVVVTYNLNYGQAHYRDGWRGAHFYDSVFTPGVNNQITPDFGCYELWHDDGTKELVGWSQSQNYRQGTDYLFPLDTQIDFTKLNNFNPDTATTLTLYGVWGPQTSGGGGGGGSTGPFTVKFAIDKKYNYLADEDIPLTIYGGQQSVIISDRTVDEYYTTLKNMGEYKNVLDDYERITRDGVEGRTWDPDTNTLTVYVKPIPVTFTVHYRGIILTATAIRQLPDSIRHRTIPESPLNILIPDQSMMN